MQDFYIFLAYLLLQYFLVRIFANQSHLMDYILGLVSIMDVFLSKQKLPISEKLQKLGYEVRFVSKTKECFAYNTKIIETPTTKEVYIYENPIFIQSKEKADLTDTSNRKKFDEMSAPKQYDSLKRKQKHYEQARWDIARIVDCNFDNRTK